MKKLRSSILAGGGVIAVMLALALLLRQCTAPERGAVQDAAEVSRPDAAPRHPDAADRRSDASA